MSYTKIGGWEDLRSVLRSQQTTNENLTELCDKQRALIENLQKELAESKNELREIDKKSFVPVEAIEPTKTGDKPIRFEGDPEEMFGVTCNGEFMGAMVLPDYLLTDWRSHLILTRRILALRAQIYNEGINLRPNPNLEPIPHLIKASQERFERLIIDLLQTMKWADPFQMRINCGMWHRLQQLKIVVMDPEPWKEQILDGLNDVEKRFFKFLDNDVCWFEEEDFTTRKY